MQQIKEPTRLLPEQKTFLLSQGKYKKNSHENMNNTLVIASDSMSRCYSDIFETITQLTNQDLIIAAKALNRVQDRLDQNLIKANPYILQIEKSNSKS